MSYNDVGGIMKRYYVVFKGQVQGVGFRWRAMMLAQQYGLTGWARNLADGDVDMEIQGPADDIDAMLAALQRKDSWIRIDDYAVKPLPTVEGEHGFGVRDEDGGLYGL